MRRILSVLFILILFFQNELTAFAEGDITVIDPPAETGYIGIVGDNGSQRTMQAYPKAENGYEFAYWSYTIRDNSTQTSTKNPIDFDIFERTVTCVFSKKQYDIKVDSTIGGTANGSGTYEHGSTITLMATPNTGYVFSCWKNGDTILSSSSTWTTPAVGNLTYTAVFTGQTNYISASPDPVGSGLINGQPSFSGSFNYAENPTITLIATPVSGFIFDGWYEGGSKISSVTSAAFDTSRDRNLIAKFNVESAIVASEPFVPASVNADTVNPDLSSKFTITYKPGQFAAPGSTVFSTEWYAGSVYLLGQYYSRQGYTQTGWSEADGGSKVFNLNAQISLSRDMTLYPYWEKISEPLYLTVDIGQGGSIRLSGGNVPNGWTGKLEPNQSYTFYFYPSPNNYVYRIGLAGWHYPIQSGNSFTVTYEMMAGKNQILVIRFADARSHPPTGDNSQSALYAALAIVSLSGFITLAVIKKKKQ